jgi:amino acid transporter
MCGDKRRTRETGVTAAPAPKPAAVLVGVATNHRGLKKDALSFWSNLVIAIASTAPAYSLAAALASVVAAVAFRVPGIMIAAFVPILFIAAAYYHLNRADPDCGTSFSWVTRAMGPYWGWMAGWGIIATDILVMPGLAQVAALYSFRLFGIAQPGWTAQTVVGVGWIVVMTAICWIGIELSARTQKLLLGAEIVILAIFAVVALAKVYGAAPPAGAQDVALAWFNPFGVSNSGAFGQAMLIAVFIYWGWDTGASVNEETQNPKTAPASAAIVSTLILVVVYVLVAVAAVAFAEPGLAKNSGDDFLAPLAKSVLPGWLAELLILAVVTSAAASTQTTILPAARTMISMAHAGALPKKFGDVHYRNLTPGFATLAMGAVSVIWYLVLAYMPNADILTDSVTATAFGIAFYYALTGFAGAIYYRRELRKSLHNFISMGLVPALGGLMMLALFVMACRSYFGPDQDNTAIFGFGPPMVFGVGALLLGVILMVLARVGLPHFFRRKPEVVDPAFVGVH